MIWEDIVRRRAIAPAFARWSATSGLAGRTLETVFDLASILRNLALDIRDCYRPELRDMRGPGPKSRAKHHQRQIQTQRRTKA